MLLKELNLVRLQVNPQSGREYPDTVMLCLKMIKPEILSSL
jgi:hypothetical protein